MSFDPTQPGSGSPQTSAPVCDNFNALKVLMGTALTTGQMQTTINGLGVLHAL
ncbi:MAG: hypothetical protein HZA88_00865 [Verrucomicrobia bacterium]|nr:hypothetical protein [Verrucomicrobiota bacterium]